MWAHRAYNSKLFLKTFYEKMKKSYKYFLATFL